MCSGANGSKKRIQVLKSKEKLPIDRGAQLNGGRLLSAVDVNSGWVSLPLREAYEDIARLRTHNQKMTVAAMQIADMNVCAHRS